MCLYEAFNHLNELKVDKPKFLAAKKALTQTINNKKRMRTLDLIHNLLFELEFYKYEIALKDTRNIPLRKPILQLRRRIRQPLSRQRLGRFHRLPLVRIKL